MRTNQDILRRTFTRLLLPLLVLMACTTIATAAGTVQFTVTDSQGDLLPCRIHLLDASGKAHFAKDLPSWRTHFTCPGEAQLDLPPGTYTYQIEHGPEFDRSLGTIEVGQESESVVSASLKRIADLASEGWFSGDLHIHRPVDEIELLMRAEDLHVAPVITWWNNRNQWAEASPPENPLVQFDTNRFYQVMAGEDEREGGALLYFHLNRPLPITGSSREYPSPMKFLDLARKHENVWIDIEKPFWWDVPLWLASGQVDSIGLANNHMCHSSMYESEAWGRPRDEERLPSPRGNGFWSQEIYYHILNCGFRIPPSAGSASGVLPNPLGYNRVYVHADKPFTHDGWWEGLKAGRSFVTNGPLLLVQANGQQPGAVFSASEGERVRIQLDIRLTTQDPITAVEIIKNGQVVKSIEPGELADGVSLSFAKPGWFLVRAITDLEHTFRFASTAPFYVETESETQRISRSSVQFFQDWIEERIERVPLKLEDEAQLEEVLLHHRQAKEPWAALADQTNAP